MSDLIANLGHEVLGGPSAAHLSEDEAASLAAELEDASYAAQANDRAEYGESACFSRPLFSAGELNELVRFRVAATMLRDAELALQAAQVAYREALLALNKAVAPVP